MNKVIEDTHKMGRYAHRSEKPTLSKVIYRVNVIPL